MAAFSAGPAWVTEWQYGQVRPLLAARAGLLVWLDRPRAVVMRQIAVPPVFLTSLGAAVALQIGTFAVGLSGLHHVTSSPGWVLVAGFAVLLAVAGAQRVRFPGAVLRDVDLRGVDLRALTGLGGLAGAWVSPAQLTELAPALAEHVGLRVFDV